MARNFDSVDEVEEALKNVTLALQVVPGQQESLLHWFIGDGTRSIVVEQMSDGMHVHHDDVDAHSTSRPSTSIWKNLRNHMCVSNDMAGADHGGKATERMGAGVSMHAFW